MRKYRRAALKISGERLRYTAAVLTVVICMALSGTYNKDVYAASAAGTGYDSYGGGYAATGQLSGVGYMAEVYDATSGLPTSDAMFILGADNGYIWIGGYAGVIRHDGSVFERMDTSNGLTSARGFFEDSRGRIWVATNDNGVVVIDGEEQTQLTYKDGLPSSSIRIFAEDKSGNIFIGTTVGICYADQELKIHEVSGRDISGERVLKLDTDLSGRIYGQAANGIIFAIDDCSITELYTDGDLGMTGISTIMADPKEAGKVYIGTESNLVYHGKFGDKADRMEPILLGDLREVHWINYDCGRVWISSMNDVGYLDENNRFHMLEGLPVNSGIEMMTSDYQGNMWLASSTQGVMKLVTNSFVDLTEKAGIPGDVTNAACLYKGEIYIGTDNGLRIIGEDGKAKITELTAYIGNTRIRCIKEDDRGNLWICTYTNEKGLICYNDSGEIVSYTTGNGMPGNEVRTVTFSRDGEVLAGTNSGLAVIKDHKLVKTVSADDDIKTTVFITVERLSPKVRVAPKSNNFGVPSRMNIMLSGLMSR